MRGFARRRGMAGLRIRRGYEEAEHSQVKASAYGGQHCEGLHRGDD